MKSAALLIGSVLVLGGVFGALRPKEWTYVPSTRNAATFGPSTISKDGTRILAIGAILLGGGVIYFGNKKNEN
jgi:hypothetical protein